MRRDNKNNLMFTKGKKIIKRFSHAPQAQRERELLSTRTHTVYRHTHTRTRLEKKGGQEREMLFKSA